MEKVKSISRRNGMRLKNILIVVKDIEKLYFEEQDIEAFVENWKDYTLRLNM